MCDRVLADLVEPGRKICYGIVQPGKPVDDGIPLLRVNNFSADGLNTDDVLKIDPSIHAKYPRSQLRGGELLVTLVGSVGQSTIVPANLAGWNVARAIGVVPIADPVLRRWASYIVRSEPAQRFFNERANTTVQTTVNLRDLAALPVPLLPRKEIESVISILGAIDDKIELNRQMNETLEASARALFRDWFVDFGPTKAKMAGATPYLAPDLWALFPDRLEADGIPENWTSLCVEEIGQHHTKSLKPMDRSEEIFEHFSIPAYDAGEQPIRQLGEEIKSNKLIVPEHAVLLSKLNPETARVWWPAPCSGPQQIASTELLAFVPKRGFSRSLIYALFSENAFRLKEPLI